MIVQITQKGQRGGIMRSSCILSGVHETRPVALGTRFEGPRKGLHKSLRA